MITDKIDQLKEHTTEIRDIMLLAVTSFNIVEYLTTAKGMDKTIIKQNQFLIHTSIVNLRVLVTELSKLYSKRKRNDHFNLQLFIDQFKAGGDYVELRIIKEEQIAEWEHYLFIVESKVDNLLKQRDSLYSHTDKDRADIKNEITLNEFKTLLGITQRIVNEVYASIYDRPSDLKVLHEPVYDLKIIVDKLSNDRIEWLRIMEKRAIEIGLDPIDVGIDTSYLK